MVYIIHILYVGEDGTKDDYHDKFMNKVIPRNSIRLLNLVGEGTYQFGASLCYSRLMNMLYVLLVQLSLWLWLL